MKQSNKNNISSASNNAALRYILACFTRKVEMVSTTKHSAGVADPEDLSGLCSLINEAKELLQNGVKIDEEPTYTPGPWVFTYGAVYQCSDMDDDEGICIAKADGNSPHTLPTERDANCRLIAAAPELLEALEDCYAFIVNGEEGGSEPRQDVINQAKAAIAKAKGE